MRREEIPVPDRTMAAADTRPLTHHPSWPGHIGIVYTCGHIYTLRLADDLPPHCPDLCHTDPPASTPHLIT
jgi:hypothetical protein